MEKDIEGFLKDLENLTLTYGIAIGGNAEDGTPYLMNQDRLTNINGKQYDALKWDEESCTYTCELVYPTPDDCLDLRG